MSKFTYRKQPRETGLRAIANPYPSTDIKLKKLKVGYIAAPSRFGDDNWRIRLAVKDNDSFRWVTFKAQFNSEDEGRKWLDAHADSVISKYDLHQFED